MVRLAQHKEGVPPLLANYKSSERLLWSEGFVVSVMSKAYELADAIKASPEYLAYVRAKGEIERHEAARIMLEDLRRKQEKIEKARLAGEELKKDDLEDFRRTYEIVGFNPYIRELFQAEIRLMGLVGEVNKIIAEACGLASPKTPEEGAE